MDTLVSKSTFYDTVSMIVPGFITLFALAIICDYNICVFCKNNPFVIPNYICISALSYLAGLLIHSLSQFVFNPCLRNNPKHISAAKEKLKGDIEDRGGKPIQGTINIVEDYYENYYKVIEHSPSISVMEAQVSFIRSMLIVFAIIIFALVVSCIKCMDCTILLKPSRIKLVVILLLVVSGILLKILMFYIQKKIYYRVFEDSYYLDILNAKTSLQGGSQPTGSQPTGSQPTGSQPTGSQLTEGQLTEGEQAENSKEEEKQPNKQ